LGYFPYFQMIGYRIFNPPVVVGPYYEKNKELIALCQVRIYLNSL